MRLMKLTAYLEKNNLRPATFAMRLGVPTSTITRLVNGEKRPGMELMEKIAKETEGLVMPNDFLSSPSTKDAPRASVKKKAKK